MSAMDETLERYSQLIADLTPQTTKNTISLLPDKDPEVLRLLLHTLVARLAGLSSESSNELAKNLDLILGLLKGIEDKVSILFLLLENLPNRRDEVHRLSVLEMLRRQDFSVMNIINLLYKSDTDALVLDILRNKEEMIADFIREATRVDNATATRNVASILPRLGPEYFVNYTSFMFLFESESYQLRNCMIDIIEMLVLHFKEESRIENIRELAEHVSERLCDSNFYVRSKALGCIGNLFKSECVLKDQRNHLIRGILERIKDKTVIVRKRCISLLGQILLNHPFRDRATLERSSDNSQECCELGHGAAGHTKAIEDDFNEFTELMESALASIVSLLNYNLKTDINEISAFIKIAYLLRLNGSRQAVHKILGIVFTKERQIVIDVFREIFSKRGDVLYEFIGDRAFEVILGCLDVDEKAIYKSIYSGHRIFESTYVLKQIRKPISESNALVLLQHVTSILFGSRNEEELGVNVRSYLNALCIMRNLRNRVEYNHEILTIATKNLIKMVFFERSVIKATVGLFYSISSNPEKTVGKFLKNLCLCKSTLKLVDSVGWIALNQFYLLERLERRLKSGAHTGRLSLGNSMVDESLREKRKSLEESRRSSLGRLSVDKGTSFSDRLSLKLGEMEDALRNKTDEEVADFFFYLKEREMLYSDTSMLHQLLPLVKTSLASSNPEVQAVGFSSLFKCMLVSSEFFNENIGVLADGLNHPSLSVRNIAVISLHDFLIFYNSSIDSSLLFDKLGDREVSKNALLAAFNLLQKNIIRIKNNSVKLVALLFDEDLGSIVRTMVKAFSSNNNTISTMFYETYLSHLGTEYVRFLAPFVGASIQESLFLKCMKNCSPSDGLCRLKAVFESFELSEKFIKDNMFREEMRGLTEQCP